MCDYMACANVFTIIYYSIGNNAIKRIFSGRKCKAVHGSLC